MSPRPVTRVCLFIFVIDLQAFFRTQKGTQTYYRSQLSLSIASFSSGIEHVEPLYLRLVKLAQQ